MGDLLNPTSWRNESVTLAGSAAASSAASSTWWTNLVKVLPNSAAAAVVLDGVDNDGGTLGDGSDDAFVSGTILTYSNNRNSLGYSIGLNRLAIVKLGNYTLTWTGTSANFNGTATVIGVANSFGWVEANVMSFDGSHRAEDGIVFSAGTMSRVHQTRADSALYEGIYLDNGSNSNGISDSTFVDNLEAGLWFGYNSTSSYNKVDRVSVRAMVE